MNYYELLLEKVEKTQKAYEQGELEVASKYYHEIFDEFEKYEIKGDENKELYIAYFEAMRSLSDEAVFNIADYLKRKEN